MDRRTTSGRRLLPPTFPPALLPLLAAFGIVSGVILLAPPDVFAVPMTNDPQGFRGIPWGASLSEFPDLILADSNERIKTYNMKNGPSVLGEAKIESMRFIAIDEQFARVAVRYRGKENHDLVLAYLQAQYGPMDRSPGMIMRGHSQQYNWRGMETDVNLTYDGAGDRGYVFIDSRVLAPRFNEGYGDTVY